MGVSLKIGLVNMVVKKEELNVVGKIDEGIKGPISADRDAWE